MNMHCQGTLIVNQMQRSRWREKLSEAHRDCTGRHQTQSVDAQNPDLTIGLQMAVGEPYETFLHSRYLEITWTVRVSQRQAVKVFDRMDM